MSEDNKLNAIYERLGELSGKLDSYLPRVTDHEVRLVSLEKSIARVSAIGALVTILFTAVVTATTKSIFDKLNDVNRNYTTQGLRSDSSDSVLRDTRSPTAEDSKRGGDRTGPQRGTPDAEGQRDLLAPRGYTQAGPAR